MESKHLFTSSPSFSLSLLHTSPDLQALLLSEVLYIRLSDRRTVQESSLAKIPQVDVKLELDGPPTREEIKKVTMQLKVDKSPGIDGIQQKSISTREKQWSIISKICSPIVGRKILYRRTSGMQSLSLCTKTWEKNQTVQTIKASLCTPLQAKSWLTSCGIGSSQQ